jgi:DNA-binding IclR family transcriptional regulator
MVGAPARSHSAARYHVPNLGRALEIFELLARHAEGLGVSEIAQALGVSKNSVFRITMTLLDYGYLLRDEESKRFTLSHKLLTLGYAAVCEHNLVEKALDILRELRDAVKETVLIGTLAGTEGVVLDQVPGTHPVKFLIDPGMRFPLHADAPGKALLAFLPEPEREALLDRIELTRFTDRTITRKEDLRRELEEIHACGYALDRAEMVEGCRCVSAPVFDHHGRPVAAIWVTGPADRFRERDFPTIGRQVVEHANRISQRLGGGLLESGRGVKGRK